MRAILALPTPLRLSAIAHARASCSRARPSPCPPHLSANCARVRFMLTCTHPQPARLLREPLALPTCVCARLRARARFMLLRAHLQPASPLRAIPIAHTCLHACLCRCSKPLPSTCVLRGCEHVGLHVRSLGLVRATRLVGPGACDSSCWAWCVRFS